MSALLNIICAAEASGELDEPTSPRQFWVHPLNQKREKDYLFENFYTSIRKFPQKFFEYYRMSLTSFDELLEIIRPSLTKQHTNMRNPICVEQRLTITIKYLSTGTCFKALQFDFHVGKSTIAEIVRETCVIIWEILQPTEMPKPTSEQWLGIADRFYQSTNFPNCLGAIDGKHLRCRNPINSGSYYFNYKKFFSIILMAVVDANLRFICIDVGAYGRESDSTVFRQCTFGKKLYAQELNIPKPTCLPNTESPPLPYVFLADEAFGLHTNLLSRARRTVECAFGVLSNKWRVLHTPLLVEPDFADEIIKACCILHNYVRRRDGATYEDMESNLLVDDLEIRGVPARAQGIEVRDAYADYFIGPGSIPFQYRFI
ncbi:uncharacterized protein LOC132946531 [Metopolophium dirhodum]|uniref:uncharacterized protein LOC132946531 n=1 Tax=Metopolophium dirhodum TaxID=44670 RepID=UPI00298F8AD5|nr:uncharacterized protein LOC132946531 [Metopolophium dirhodum]